MNFRDFGTAPECLAALGGEIVAHIRAAIDTRMRATLALSGGRSPLPLYRRLAGTDMDWSKVMFALVDERWVENDSEASNEKQLRGALAPALGKGAGLTGMKTPDESAAAGLGECEARYATLSLPFDSLLLGMGADGHTASLFSGAEGLTGALDENAKQRCTAITARESDVTGPYAERMTLTLPTILQSRQIDLLIFGEAKRDVLDRALAGGNILEMPVRAVLQQTRAPVTVWWAP